MTTGGRSLLALGALVALATAVAAGETPRLVPLERNTAPEPTKPDPLRPEELTFASGAQDGHDFIHARGYVRAPLEKVWLALRQPEVMTDRRRVGEWRILPGGSDGAEVRFVVRSVVRAFVTVEFDVAHWQGVVEGTPERPLVVVGRWTKVSGTRFISLLDGSFVLRRVDEHTTEVQLIEHLSALNTGVREMKTYLGDVFAGTVALAHGRPLPAPETID